MSGRTPKPRTWIACASALLALASASATVAASGDAAPAGGPHERAPVDAPAPPATKPVGMRMTPQVARGVFISTQVNVGTDGLDIVGDAANEPSIAIDPGHPLRMAIGWRQFDNVASNFRQAGVAHSRDGGWTWTVNDPLDAGVFRSDPVLDADAEGAFYYYSLMSDYTCQLFKSLDGGATWLPPIDAYGGDKAWMAIDRTGDIGHGNIYFAWDNFGCCGENWFTRFTDGGNTFAGPVPIPEGPIWGVTAIGTNGEVYVAGRRVSTNTRFVVAKSSTIADPAAPLAFDFATEVALDGRHVYAPGWGPNPGGLLGQVWIAVDHSTGPTRGNVYLLSSVNNINVISDPLDVHFSRSTDGGLTWSPAVRINHEPPELGAWQWFGTLAVAPTGRIDVIFNDTRNFAPAMTSELHYTFSNDAGETWAESVPISPPFDPWVGYPNQNKLGDYYDMVSDTLGADIAYAATFNGGQDIYHLRIDHFDCNGNGVSDLTDIVAREAEDCNGNWVIDACELATAHTSESALAAAIPIPDGDSNGITHTILVDRHGTIMDLDVHLVIDHAANSDLNIELSHRGTAINLIDRPGMPAAGSNGLAGTGYDIVLDDEGAGGPIESIVSIGPVLSPPGYQPNQALAGFDGQTPLGRWTLRIVDAAPGATGQLDSWSLHFVLAPNDCDADGNPDDCEVDCQSNSVPDDCELSSGSSADIDSNGVPDECDPDCNINGFPDGHDLAVGASIDCNVNGVPDECESLGGGDYNGDGSTDIDDLAGLVLCLAGPDATPDSLSAECIALCLAALDLDADGDIDLMDFAGAQRVFVSD